MSSDSVRHSFGLEDSICVVPLRLLKGDDASCFNLNQIANPSVLGVRPEQLQGRFSLVSTSDQSVIDNMWNSLDSNRDDLIPAFADQTVIQWSLGKRIGDTLFYTNEMGHEIHLLLIGGLASSVFQGNVLISERNFLKNFPSSSGSNVFLIDGDSKDLPAQLELAFRDRGWSQQSAPLRLAAFKSIENTYLNIFLILGAIGLLLGSIGIVVVLIGSFLERKFELALLLALGYSKRHIFNMIFKEYCMLAFIGILSGAFAALVAVLPSLLNQNSISFSFFFLVTGVLLLNAVLWILLVSIFGLKTITINEALKND